MEGLKNKTVNALKWSSITELMSKLVTPVINMILARILAPEAFGVLATVVMIISFAEIFVESGFQKFLIQHDFENKLREDQFYSVAFWSNLIFSLFIWTLIIIFNQKIAEFSGAPTLGIPIIITGVTVPIYGCIGIQTSKLKKELNFKTLFYVRIVASLVPLFITLPLAIVGLDYWSLIIGNISGIVVQAVILAFKGGFVPKFYFSFHDLKFMLNFGVWTMLDGVATWATAWIDTLLISRYMSDYYLGLYKNSSSTVSTLFSMVTAAFTPVLFSSLSRLQDNQEEFSELFFKFQRILCTILLPMGIGLFFYREFATSILFGSKWSEASEIVGIMALTSALRLILVSIYSEAYRAKGRFYIPFILQFIDVIIFVPTCLIAVKQGFWPLVYARAIIKLDLVLPSIFVAWKFCGLHLTQSLKACFHSIIACGFMIMIIFLLRFGSGSVIWNVFSILICILVYFSVILLFPEERSAFKALIILKFHKNNI